MRVIRFSKGNLSLGGRGAGGEAGEGTHERPLTIRQRLEPRKCRETLIRRAVVGQYGRLLHKAVADQLQFELGDSSIVKIRRNSAIGNVNPGEGLEHHLWASLEGFQN